MSRKETIEPTSVESTYKRTPRTHDLSPTHLDGVSLRVEKGVEPDILRRTISQELLPLGRRGRREKVRANQWGKKLDKTKSELVEIANEHSYLRGIESEKDNLRVQITPRDPITYDQPQLRENLGSFYSSIVTENHVVSIDISPKIKGLQAFEGLEGEDLMRKLQDTFELVFTEMGISPEDAEMLVKSQFSISVDENKLKKEIKDGNITLTEGTRKVENRVWTVQFDDLRPSVRRDAVIEDPDNPQQKP